MNFLVRDATPADLDAIHAIDGASFKQPWARASFGSALQDPQRSLVLVLESGETVRAFGIAWNVGDEGEIATLAVDASGRGQGWGEAIMNALIERLAHRGVRSIFLEVRPSNAAARRLYQRLNFAEVGRRPNYYADGETAILLKLLLP